MRWHKNYLLIWVFFLLPIAYSAELEKSAQDSEPARIYRSPEERREAGLGRQVTDWLQVSGLVEVSKMYQENNSRNGDKLKEYDRPVSALQLGFNLMFSEWLSAEFIFDAEYDFEVRSSENQLTASWDEAFFEVSLGEWGIKAGRQYVPFGEYYSHFVTGPILEFGETRGDGVIIDYSFNEMLEVSAFVFDSDVVKQNRDGKLDWGGSIEYVSDDESVRIGLGYLSDLAESDENFLSENNDRYEDRVSAWNAYILLGFDQFEVTAEYLQANNRFREFDANENKPDSFNVEFAYFPVSFVQLAARYEHSKEFRDAPRHQYGLAGTWAPTDHFTVTMEYLHGRYKNNFALDDNDNDLDDRDIVAIEMSLEF